MFRGSELLKMMSMLVLLAVLGTLVVRGRQPGGWQGPGADQADDAPAQSDSPLPPAGEPAVPDVATGPTDEDPEQRADAAEEFEAVSDGTLGIQPEEMLAYWRLIFWTEHQSLEMLQRRARANLVFNDLMQFPAEHRGKLVRLDLNVRRVLAYDVAESPFGIRRLYEIWGWTDESKAWLYCVVTAHLPEGMPIGPDVYERARFVGYFFKLQGYHEAGAKPRAAALKAPLLVGRLARHPSITERQAVGDDWWSLGIVALLCVVLGGAAAYQYVHGRRSARRQAVLRQHASQTTRQWLHNGFSAGEDEGVSPPWCEVGQQPRNEHE